MTILTCQRCGVEMAEGTEYTLHADQPEQRKLCCACYTLALRELYPAPERPDTRLANRMEAACVYCRTWINEAENRASNGDATHRAYWRAKAHALRNVLAILTGCEVDADGSVGSVAHTNGTR